MTHMTQGELIIRPEALADRAAVRGVNCAAFGGNTEADLVERLHAGGDVLCGLVAEIAGRVVGHILFSRLPIVLERGIVTAAALAPLAVLPERQRQGIGTALVHHGLALCHERGVPAVIVLGDPVYYGRFGFSVDLAGDIQTPWSGPHLMVIELVPGSLGDGRGAARYPPAFADLSASETTRPRDDGRGHGANQSGAL
jgi:putative acetyltransferase